MIQRRDLLGVVRAALKHNPVVAILGPRQCGKTTLAGELARGNTAERFDLENPVDLARLANPMTALERLRGLVVVDEAQRLPSLFPVLRVLADRPKTPARFLLLGSAAPEIVRGVSESLAGRIATIEVGGFDLREVGPKALPKLWSRGGLPRSFLASSEPVSLAWRQDFIGTFLERDIPQLGITIPAAALRRFWTMLAHFHGQIWNGAELARSLGTSEPTARRYLDLLTGAFVVRQLQPWHENIGKRQVKAPKVYVRDSGLLHALLSVGSLRELEAHPKYGASWEGFALEQAIGAAGAWQTYFWATHAGAELDLLLLKKGKRFGFEFKAAEAPTATKSMHVALADLKLERLYVVYPGARAYPMDKKIEALPLAEIPGLSGL
ncbi:MAG: ATP-binding protein [Elusimicrobia bacterium]|nr:ATP-binding protein [Elusimicrobiota bacterium]